MSRPKILVVEDNAADIELLRFALDRQGDYELEVLEDGEAACGSSPSTALVSILQIPALFCWTFICRSTMVCEILDALKRAPALEHIQVIVLSSITSPEAEAEIRAKGAIYRTKPVTLKKFLELGSEIFALCKDSVAA